MKIKEAFKKAWKYLKSNPFRIIISIIFIIGCSMIGFYIFQFSHNGLSEYTTDWANFGAYFGSITGLLAFAGVLYTASLSDEKAKKAEERAIKAEKESVAREERDQFFKMLELLREQAKDLNSKIGSFGNNALQNFAQETNNAITKHLIYNFIKEITEEKWDEFRKKYDKSSYDYDCYSEDIVTSEEKLCEGVLSVIISLYINYFFPEDETFEIGEINSNNINLRVLQNKLKISDIKEIIAKKNIKSLEEINRKHFDELYSYIDNGLSQKVCYYTIQKTSANIFSYSKNDKYCNSCILMINTISSFSDDSKNKFYEILKSQIAGVEPIMLLLYVLSNHSDKNLINNILSNHLFSNFCYKDLLLTNSIDFRGKEENFVSGILELYIENLKSN